MTIEIIIIITTAAIILFLITLLPSLIVSFLNNIEVSLIFDDLVSRSYFKYKIRSLFPYFQSFYEGKQ